MSPSFQLLLQFFLKKNYLGEVNRIFVDETLSKAITGDGSVWLDKWWSVIFNTSKHPVLSAVVKGSLLIFTGLQLKSSFSMMNNIITKKLGRMLSETHSAIFHCYSICVFWTISSKKHFQRSSQPPSCIRLQCSASQYCSIFLLCKISGKIEKQGVVCPHE